MTDKRDLIIAKQEELIKLQKSYIEFLSEKLGSHAMYLKLHGIVASETEIKIGAEYRSMISNDEKELSTLRQLPDETTEEKRKDFCLWYYAQSQPLDANKVFEKFSLLKETESVTSADTQFSPDFVHSKSTVETLHTENKKLYPCPYSEACTCILTEPCMGCETFAKYLAGEEKPRFTAVDKSETVDLRRELIACDVCGKHPSVIVQTQFGIFCMEHARYV